MTRDNNEVDMFAAPVPGESLTKPVGARPYEQPPKYVTEDEAMYAVLNSVTNRDTGAMIGIALEQGMYAADIASTLLQGGVAEGKWTPDVAALIAKRTLGAVAMAGHTQGVEGIRYMRPKENNTIEKLLKVNKKEGTK